MKIAVQFTKNEELKALPIILRHSSGFILRNRIYIVNEAIGKELGAKEIQFKLLARLPENPPNLRDFHGRIL